MRDDFCAFILTHGRPDKVLTYRTLRRAGYTGKIFIVVDDEDKTRHQYMAEFGEQVLVFSKADIASRFDEADNFGDRRSIFYARNACFDLAKLVGCKYFIQLDDDYHEFQFRVDRNYDQAYFPIRKLDAILSEMLAYYESIAASINIRPGHNYYFYVCSVNTVGKSAFVEAVGQPSDDASGYLDFFKGEIGKTHLAQELWTQIDNGQLAPDLAEIRTSITDVSNEITQTVNKKLEDQSAAIQQIQKVQVDTNNNLNSMWAVKLQQMQDGRLYIAGIGAGIENTPDGMQSQVLLAADRIAMINPANGNTKPMFVGQGDQIFMNEVFLKYLTAPTITSGGNPPAFSMTPDGKLTAKNADISGSVNANAGTLNNVTINENCQIKGKLSANQIEGDIVKTVGKAFPRDSRAPERWPSGTITVRIYDDQPFDRQIVIPAVAFSGAKHEREHTDIYSSCRLIVKKNGAEIYNRTALDNTLIYSGVIDMPAGHGHMTLEFSVSAWLVNDWYPTASISDLLVVVMKKATAGISIS